MKKRSIIVVGASAGGIVAFQQLMGGLLPDLDAAIFIVWHMAPTVRGVLPQLLSRFTTIPAAHAYDNEPVQTNRIYVAPPDHHMLVENGHIRITHGPKENRFRPAIDPLFRSAAYAYGNRVMGVLLSGALDDGTAGLWAIKHYGGLALVQDPQEALVSDMPENAIRQVAIDYVLPVAQLATQLVRLAGEDVSETPPVSMEENEKTKTEIRIAADETALGLNLSEYGQPSRYVCPECHGVLTQIKEGPLARFRCHTGHAYSADTLLAAITEQIEDNLYGAVRGIDESVILLNRLGDQLADANQPKQAGLYFQKAQEALQRGELIRQAIRAHEPLSLDSIQHQATDTAGTEWL
ncbi:two-component system chemotaxis response regulator CheB [Spirosoma oryzae]|uniref:protein-glutamate methylesterase n=1 Tax=Spirosoma oryzae TaxID=1469603 RepID=A0A2T0RXH1_9BACT|nr:chemotaxis protein CheB [Spirosoma oryzae]PRY25884.1 two-component system chemotaxis response regulator CheB [Spirosoma oryzae]